MERRRCRSFKPIKCEKKTKINFAYKMISVQSLFSELEAVMFSDYLRNDVT